MRSAPFRGFTLRLLIACLALLAACHSAAEVTEDSQPELRVMAWNIWHGGREDGETLGPQRVIEVIRESGADLVAMQETYGSGELISEALGYSFHPRGTNLSIHSRYPIRQDLSVFEEFKCVGALIELPGEQLLAFFSIWLPYDGEIWAPGTRDGKSPEQLLAACASSAVDLAAITKGIDERLLELGLENVPVIIAGDFNSMSHLDYTPAARSEYGVVLDWPTSRVITDAGYRDVYRQVHPEVNRQLDRTWTPRFPEQEQDRIDFVYLRGDQLRGVGARVIDEHPAGFPSDHGALLTRFSRGD